MTAINFLLQIQGTHNKIGDTIQPPMLTLAAAYEPTCYVEMQFYKKYASLLLTDEDPVWRKRAEDFLTTDEQKRLKLQEYYADIYNLVYADDDHILLDENGQDIFDEGDITDYLVHKKETPPEKGIFTVIKPYYHIEQMQVFGGERHFEMNEILRESSSEIHQDLIELIKESDLFASKVEHAVYEDSFSASVAFLVKGRVEFFDDDFSIYLDGIVDINNIPILSNNKK
jgi:hypothetical protein